MTPLARRIASLVRPENPVLVSGPTDFLTVDALADRQTAQLPDLLDAGATVALCVQAPVAFIRCLIALDGRVDALLLLSPSLPPAIVAALMAQEKATHLVSDRDDLALIADVVRPEAIANPVASADTCEPPTRWLMTTSGTTGTPKVVAHTLTSLGRSVHQPARDGRVPIWGLLYDPSRFAGMQVVLQALMGGGTLLAPDPRASLGERVAFLHRGGCSHLSATPSLWRRLLMSPDLDQLPLRQITLGGEIADARLLGALAARFPQAQLTSIYASTETGVGFSVHDALPGFPITYLDDAGTAARLKVEEGRLWVRPPSDSRTSLGPAWTVDTDGYVMTEDRVEIDAEHGRVRFLGRSSSTVNVGGVKVQLEDVERVACEHPGVAACKVFPKPSPIVGTLLSLAVVPLDPGAEPAALSLSVRQWCRERLSREACPASVRVVDSIDINSSGKISRADQ